MADRRRTDPAHRAFTIDQANATLPLVRAIVNDAVTIARDLDRRREHVGPLLDAHAGQLHAHPLEGGSHDPYLEEMVEVQQRLEDDRRRLQSLEAELAELGAKLVDPIEGQVEFPTRLDHRTGYLCWKPGEPEIRYWRPDRAGRRRRLPLTALSIAGPSNGGRNEPPEAG